MPGLRWRKSAQRSARGKRHLIRRPSSWKPCRPGATACWGRSVISKAATARTTGRSPQPGRTAGGARRAAAALAAAEVALAQAQDDEQRARSLADTQGRESHSFAPNDGLQRLLQPATRARPGRRATRPLRHSGSGRLRNCAGGPARRCAAGPGDRAGQRRFWSDATGTGPAALPAGAGDDGPDR